jgi:YVTN family beta-propeller protein
VAVWRFRRFRGAVVFGLAGVLVGVVPDGVSAVVGRARCRPTAFVTNSGSGTVSTIDSKTRTKNPTDITVGSFPAGVAVTPDGKTVLVANRNSATMSTIDVKTRVKHATDIAVGTNPGFIVTGLAIAPDGKTAFVNNSSLGVAPGINLTVSTIDVKTRTKNPTDITVGSDPLGVAVTPDGTTVFVTNYLSDSVSTIDVKTRTKTQRHRGRFRAERGGLHTGWQNRVRHQPGKRNGVDD